MVHQHNISFQKMQADLHDIDKQIETMENLPRQSPRIRAEIAELKQEAATLYRTISKIEEATRTPEFKAEVVGRNFVITVPIPEDMEALPLTAKGNRKVVNMARYLAVNGLPGFGFLLRVIYSDAKKAVQLALPSPSSSPPVRHPEGQPVTTPPVRPQPTQPNQPQRQVPQKVAITNPATGKSAPNSVTFAQNVELRKRFAGLK